MEPKSKMEARPPALMEAVVRLLTPEACREHVLGDLCERYRSRRQYAFEALTTLPFVVASRIRRTSSIGLLTLQVIGVCVGFWTSSPSGLAEMTAAAAGALIMLLARDAYRGSVQAWPRTAAGDALAAVAGAVAAQVAFAMVANPSSFNLWIVLGNSLAAFFMVFTLQVLSGRGNGSIVPVHDRVRFVVVYAVWSAVFAAAASAVVGGASGLLFAAMVTRGMHPAADHELMASIGRIWATTPTVAIVGALALCIKCRLPGTRGTAPRSLA
jgi:hypothetical protein